MRLGSSADQVQTQLRRSPYPENHTFRPEKAADVKPDVPRGDPARLLRTLRGTPIARVLVGSRLKLYYISITVVKKKIVFFFLKNHIVIMILQKNRAG
jgi:hypothetical protein